MSDVSGNPLFLPEELIYNILLRLPVKSVLVCTSVCKAWNSFIKSPSFVSSHLSRTISSYKDSGNLFYLLQLESCSLTQETATYSFSLRSDDEKLSEYSSIHFPYKHEAGFQKLKVTTELFGALLVYNLLDLSLFGKRFELDQALELEIRPITTSLQFINQALNSGSFPTSLTEAHVVLIPKESNPEVVHKFRPITLLNVAYKVLSKVIVNRIRPYLQNLVSPLQASFLPQRSTTDNILLTQEAVHSMSRLSGRRGAMIMKIDLHKAFDSVSWSFLREVLVHFNFPATLIDLIIFCITSNRLTILWNGESLPSFAPGRGLRQGDPLSPYLFILVMEKLSHMIQQSVDTRGWKPFKVSRGGFALSHLFFADDLMLFAEASSSKITNILAILRDFASQSGLQLNVGKSKLFVSRNIQRPVARSLSRASGIPLTSNLGMYLGVPIKHGHTKASSYQYIVDKIRSKLANWKLKSLSLAGRKILIQSVTSSIATHTMQSTMLPVAITNQIDKLNRNFLWGDVETSRSRPHLVHWDVVCQGKDRGGLGLRKARVMNTALIAKLGWKLVSGSSSPWCIAFRHKYLSKSDFWSVRRRNSNSMTWKNIMDVRPLLRKGIRWQPGFASTLSLWRESWATSRPLSELLPHNFEDPEVLSWCVRDIQMNGAWDLTKLHDLLPLTALDKIRAILPPQSVEEQDQLYWSLSPGAFTVASAYEAAIDDFYVTRSDPLRWNWLWKTHSSEKIKFFLWIIFHGRLFTNSLRFYRHLAESSVCTRCGEEDETMLHVLRDCPLSREVWHLHGWGADFFAQDNVYEWIKHNALGAHAMVDENKHVAFLATTWLLWKARNAFVFNNNRQTPRNVVYRSVTLSRDTQLALGDLTQQRVPRRLRWVRWIPPEEGLLKLNSDGSVNDRDHAAAGGVIRDSSGAWIAGYSVNIGTTSVFLAELWGIYIGLKHCLDLGITRLHIELDSSSLVHVLLSDISAPLVTPALLRDCFRLLRQLEYFVISHTLREGNAAADFMANLGHHIDKSLR